MQLFLSSDFNIRTLRRKPRSVAKKLMDLRDKLLSHQLTNLGKILQSYIPQSLFDECTQKLNCRRRIFSVENTFWGFFLQTLQSDSSCQSIVHQFRVNASHKNDISMSSSTSAYCQARKRLPLDLLDSAFKRTNQIRDDHHPLINRRVVCADGTGLLASDTAANQNVWPQQVNQREGCAFPQIRLCGLFNLHTGVAISYKLGNKRSHELPLLRDQDDSFKENDVFIGDKGFICFYDQARLLELGVDSIVALAKRKPVSTNKAVRRLGNDDLLITIPKRTSKIAMSRYPKGRWEALPDTLEMRQIKVHFTIPGYRSSKIYLLTTLLDEVKYPANLIAELYRQRWDVELYFRDLKTTLGMEMLRGKTPDMVEKEILMFFIVNNIIRLLMLDGKSKAKADKMAFKSCIQTLLAYCFREVILDRKKIHLHRVNLAAEISKCTLNQRLGRVEPREIKRRPKPFKLMTKPRSMLKLELLMNAA